MRQGEEPRGIVASGRITSEAYPDENWQDSDSPQYYNDVVFDALLDPQIDSSLSFSELLEIDGRAGFWNTPSSGIRLADEVAMEVERRWARFLKDRHIVPASPTSAAAEQRASRDWSENEIKLIVADYMSMLKAELAGEQYSKTEHRRRLKPFLNGRSDGSIEFKHANISAALLERHQTYISGYKPRSNFQRSLLQAVDDELGQIADMMDVPAIRERLEPENPVVQVPLAAAAVIEDAPEEIILPTIGQSWRSRRGRKIDFVERDAKNRKLGKAGEQFALEVERKRLVEAGRDDLAAKVVWASQKWGDGLGFDVLSFDHQTEAERRIEVKTTSMPKFFPFNITANELACSDAEPDQYHLYRVFNFTTVARLFVISGSLSARCDLQPLAYRAGLKSG